MWEETLVLFLWIVMFLFAWGGLNHITYNMKYRRLRRYRLTKKRASDKVWLKKELRLWGERDDNNNHFLKFSCNSFFVGHHMARINQDEYEQKQKRIDRKVKQMYFFLSVTGDKY